MLIDLMMDGAIMLLILISWLQSKRIDILSERIDRLRNAVVGDVSK